MTLKEATLLAIDDDYMSLINLEGFLQSRCKKLFLQVNMETIVDVAIQLQPDIILLDILMGDIDGYTVCAWLKEEASTRAIPVIFISSLLGAVDKAKGFEVGGVDYITKPFELEEVVARIENCLRLHAQINQHRENPPPSREEKIALQKKFVLYTERLVLFSYDDNCLIQLNYKECCLLQVVVRTQQALVTRQQLVEGLGKDYVSFDQRCLETLISRLRKKLAPYDFPIRAMKNYGYYFAAEVQEKTKV
jgi:DNA-binding response OmpR family regulator